MNGGYDSNSVSVVGKQSNPACHNFTILNVNLIFRFSFLYQLLYQRLSRTAARISQRTAARPRPAPAGTSPRTAARPRPAPSSDPAAVPLRQCGADRRPGTAARLSAAAAVRAQATPPPFRSGGATPIIIPVPWRVDLPPAEPSTAVAPTDVSVPRGADLPLILCALRPPYRSSAPAAQCRQSSQCRSASF